MGMYENHVLHGGPNDGEVCRIRMGTVAVQAGGGRYARVQVTDAGPFVRNEYHWVAGV